MSDSRRNAPPPDKFTLAVLYVGMVNYWATHPDAFRARMRQALGGVAELVEKARENAAQRTDQP